MGEQGTGVLYCVLLCMCCCACVVVHVLLCMYFTPHCHHACKYTTHSFQHTHPITQATQEQFSDWAALGSVGDLTPWINDTLHTVADWQREYDALRVAGRELDKLPSEVLVGCFRVGLLKLKADVEVACRRLHDALTDVLQDKVCFLWVCCVVCALLC